MYLYHKHFANDSYYHQHYKAFTVKQAVGSHLSLPDYKAKPDDSAKTFAELFRPVIGKDTKLIIVGDVMNQKNAEDALNYTEIGRAHV